MPRISGLATLTAPALAGADLCTVVDGSDPTMSATTGTNKKMTATEFAAGIQALNAGTALLTGRAGGQTFAGGTAPDDDLFLKSSSAGAPTGDIVFLGGAAGATTLGRILNNGQFLWSGLVASTAGFNISGTFYGIAAIGTGTFNDVSAQGDITAVGNIAVNGNIDADGSVTAVGGVAHGLGFQTHETFLGLDFLATAYDGGAANIDLRGTRGSYGGALSPSLANDILANFRVGGSRVTSLADVARIACVATQNYTDTAAGSRWEFYNIPNNGTIQQLVLTLDQNKIAAFTGTVSAIGGFQVTGTFWGVGAFGAATVASIAFGAAGTQDLAGTGSPQGVVAANPGSTFRRSDGGAGTTFYVKETGGSTSSGWTAK